MTRVKHPYINIHSHHTPKHDEVVIQNHRFSVEEQPNCESYFSVGIHPWDENLAHNVVDFEQLIQHKNCLAIGECGLDALKQSNLANQTEWFTFQIKMGIKYNKPIIIHCVKAFDDLIKLSVPHLKTIPFIIHGFNKSTELAEQLINKGFYLSLSHQCLVKHHAINLPLDKLFLETDDDKTLLINQVYEIATQKMNLELDVLKEKINHNFAQLFFKP